MAMLGLRVPHEIGRLLQTLDVPGKKVDSGSYHVTLFYLGDNVGIEQLTKAVAATYDVVRQAHPFSVQVDRISSFPGNEDGVPIICPVEAKALSQLREQLAGAFDQAGVEYSKTYPVFKGHVTLAYHDGDAPEDEMLYAPLEWGVAEVVLWGGDEGDSKFVATFPFDLQKSKTAFFRSLIRLARHVCKFNSHVVHMPV